MKEILNNSVSGEATVTATADTTTDSFVPKEEFLRLKGYEFMLEFVKSGLPVRVIPLDDLGSPNEGLVVFIWSKDGEEMNVQKFQIGMDDGGWLLELWDEWVEMLPDLISEHKDTVGYILADSAEEAWEKLYREMREANNEAASEDKNMNKIWIVRERMEWHNCDADDDTFAYATEEMAKKALIEKYEETKRYLADYEEEIESETFTSDSGRIITEREDYYFIWVEEIDMFNE